MNSNWICIADEISGDCDKWSVEQDLTGSVWPLQEASVRDSSYRGTVKEVRTSCHILSWWWTHAQTAFWFCVAVRCGCTSHYSQPCIYFRIKSRCATEKSFSSVWTGTWFRRMGKWYVEMHGRETLLCILDNLWEAEIGRNKAVM